MTASRVSPSQQPGKSAGQLAYERDLERTPRYQNGKERAPWHDLSDIAQWSWEQETKAYPFQQNHE